MLPGVIFVCGRPGRKVIHIIEEPSVGLKKIFLLIGTNTLTNKFNLFWYFDKSNVASRDICKRM